MATVVRLRPGVGDEAELVAGLRERRAAAVDCLIERYGALVRRSLYRVLGNACDLDDLEQETYITVLARCHTLREPSALRSFVVSVAMRLARNELRKRAIRRFVGLDSLERSGAVTAHDPSGSQVMRRVHVALDQVDANARVAFVLRHVEGYELTETAAACGCSLATVKRWLARAEQTLKALAAQDPVLQGLLKSAASEGEGAP